MENFYVPSTWRRLGAHAIDQFVRLPFYLPFAKTAMQLAFSDDEVYISVVELLIFFLIPAIYEGIFLVAMQRTPGKWVLGLKVVPANDPDGKLTWDQCLLRPLVSRLSFFFSEAIFALAFFRYDRTHLSDWVAQTRVLQAEPRRSLPRIRWFIGSLFVILYCYEGLHSASTVLSGIDWGEKRIEVRSLMGLEDMEDFEDFEIDI